VTWWPRVRALIVFLAGLGLLLNELVGGGAIRWGVVVLALVLMGITTADQIRSMVTNVATITLPAPVPDENPKPKPPETAA
jgi:hypothetical protein